MLLLKSAPQDLPYSFGVMSRVILLYFVSGFIVQISAIESFMTISMMVWNIVVLLSFSYAVLVVRKLKARFVQTVSALFGTGIIFNLMAWPFIGLMGGEGLSDVMSPLIALLMLSMLSWELLVRAHIYKNALNLQMAHSIMLSFALFFISMVSSHMIFPEIH